MSDARVRSTTDPEAKLYRKGPGMEAKLAFLGHALMENRSGLLVEACLTQANGHAERLAALAMIERRASRWCVRLRRNVARTASSNGGCRRSPKARGPCTQVTLVVQSCRPSASCRCERRQVPARSATPICPCTMQPFPVIALSPCCSAGSLIRSSQTAGKGTGCLRLGVGQSRRISGTSNQQAVVNLNTRGRTIAATPRLGQGEISSRARNETEGFR